MSKIYCSLSAYLGRPSQVVAGIQLVFVEGRQQLVFPPLLAERKQRYPVRSKTKF